MNRSRQMLLTGGLLCILLFSGSGLVVPVSARPAHPDVSPNSGLHSPAAAAVQIATTCQYDYTTNTRLIQYSADITNSSNAPVTVFYTVLLETTFNDPHATLWERLDQTARTAVVLPPGTTNIFDQFSHQVFPPQYAFYRVGIVLEQSLTASAPAVYYSDVDFICFDAFKR